MTVTKWNSVVQQYSKIGDSRRDIVFPRIIERLSAFEIRSLLDYGGGDGLFAKTCAMELALDDLVSYDPAPNAVRLAGDILEDWGFARSIDDTSELEGSSFEAVTFNAVWMCLPDWEFCIRALSDVGRLLKRGGYFIASVTHPCFRTLKFETYAAHFDMRDYLNDGIQFPTDIFDDKENIRVFDTHWSLGAMSRQLRETGFSIDEIEEVPNMGREDNPKSEGSSWLILHCHKN